MDWLYDGSFGGLLTTIFQVYSQHDQEARIWPAAARDDQAQTPLAGSGLGRAAPDLFDQMAGPPGSHVEAASGPRSGAGPLPDAGAPDRAYARFITVEYDEPLARRVLEGLRREAGDEGARNLRNAFLHRDGGAENSLLGYVRLCMDQGRRALRQEAVPAVRLVLDRARAVTGEAHRFAGILRFQELDGDLGLYAAMEPDHNILSLLGEHFQPRMGAIPWLIHDRRRHLALCHRAGTFDVLEDFQLEDDLPLSGQELEFQSLWQGFFRAIANPGRINPRLQMSHLPKKYWKYLIELPGTSPGASEGAAAGRRRISGP